MTITQLRYLLELYNSSNATQAAQKLHITRPALTNGIRQLEQDLNCQLIKTTSNNQIIFTDNGKKVVLQAQKIISDVDELYKIVQTQNDHVLRIGLVSNIQPIMEELSNYRDGKISLTFQVQDELYQSIKHDQLDLAFTLFTDQHPLSDPDMQFDPLFKDHLGAFTIAGNPLNQKKEVTYSDLQKESIIISHDQDNEKFIQKIIQEHGPLNIILTTPGINLVHHIMDNETVLIGRKTQLEFSPYKNEVNLTELPIKLLNQITFSFGWLYRTNHHFTKDERKLIRSITASFY
ncbi:LysR family transcriptional regulator [uncultured Lactobacillus sp.]|uniref:LysR family transcriptional regulator n=1 Tax=uncultured Lactobacillus sp. TaxID=153152 RepID=UPI002803C7CB|nr:LysR family transcriptional regulator [uncultured Lactobacillus sp.]